MLKYSKITKGLSAVVCAVVLFGSPLLASDVQNVCENTDCLDADISVKAEYIADRSASGVDLSELIKILELLQSNSAGFFEPLTQNLSGFFDTIIGIIKTVSSGGTVSFDMTSIGPRIQLAVATAKNIAIAAAKDADEGLYYKEEHVLVKYGFGVTGVILDMINPFTTSSTINGDKAKLERILKEALDTPNMTDSSVANTNIKEEFETLLRDCRNLVISRWQYLQGKSEFENFKKQISKSTILRLDSVLRYGEAKEAMSVLQNEKAKIEKIIEDIGYDKVVSSVFDREALAVELRSARLLKFTDFKDKSPKVNLALENEILRITGIRLNPLATMAEIKQAQNDLTEAIQVAKDSDGAGDVLASKESKDELLRELHIARFLKFRRTAKKGWKVNNELDNVVLSLNWTSINIFASQSEVDRALTKIKEAMEKAEAAPDLS